MLKLLVLAAVAFFAYRFFFKPMALPSSSESNEIPDDDLFVEYEEIQDD
ncbi:MAG: hypothetical protein OEQ53_00760 [Saprospiraceae bacterium]|nr:hypothetical protein [Saprospiraceae bacterium]